MTGPAAGFLIRPAGEADLDAITAFEIDIAHATYHAPCAASSWRCK